MKIWQHIIKEIIKHDVIILHRHILPDGDAIGSQMALKHLIKLNFPHKKVYAVGTMVAYLQFLGTTDEISDDMYYKALVIVTDTANTLRIDDERYKLAATIIKIDHHPNHDQYGKWQWVDISYPAACEMIADFIFANNLKCDAFIAECLLVGIITDTTRFMLRQISSRTFALTSKLLTYYKKNIVNIYNLLDYKTTNETQLLSYCYSNYQISAQGVISLKISNDYLQHLAISADKAAFYVNIFSNIINHPLWIVGIEYSNQHIRCELRSSNQKFKVNKIAQKFGGGGHASAAGCKVSNWNQFAEVILALDTL